MAKLLILDDREDYLRALRGALRGEFEVVTAKTVEEAQQAMDASMRVALVDVRLSDEDEADRGGVAFLQWAKDRFPGTQVLMMSAYGDIDAVVDAFDLGADYFLRKPIDLRELKSLLHEFAERGAIPEKTAELKRRLKEER